MFLSQEQNELLEQVRRRDPSIAEMYYGGLCILADESNPFHLQLAAHSFREVLAHLVELTGQSVVFGEGTKSRIKPVRDAFYEWKDSLAENANAAGAIVGLSEDLETALNEYFAWDERSGFDFRKKTALLLTQLAGPLAALPSDVIAEDLEVWIDIDRYFKLVAHGKHLTTREALTNKLFMVEDILLRRLRPRPVSDLNEIDALLAEDDDAE